VKWVAKSIERSCRRRDNIKVGFEHLNKKCIKMTRDMVHFLAVVNQVMKLWFDKSAAFFYS
jgi:hypothetical protein